MWSPGGKKGRHLGLTVEGVNMNFLNGELDWRCEGRRGRQGDKKP